LNFLLDSISWNFHPLPNNILEVYCDASGSGMGFWYPSLHLGFQSNLPPRSLVEDIFFYEALCVASAIHDGVTQLPHNGWLAVYTDSLNTVYLFNSLSRDPGYNHLLIDVVEVILTFGIDFRVFHVYGESNVVEDHLSWWHAVDAIRVIPELRVSPFLPPWNALGEVKKWSVLWLRPGSPSGLHGLWSV
jgi:hypothetical protein